MILAQANRQRILANPVFYQIGLTEALVSVPAQNNGVWTFRSADISQYIGATAKLVIRYLSGSSYTGDVQFDDFSLGGNFADPEIGTNNFERSQTNAPSSYLGGISWSALTTATSGNGLFLRDSGGTGSSGTGLTSGNTGSWYYYTETSGSGVGYPSKYFWLRSPSVVISNSLLSFYSAQLGTTCGAFEVYLDIIS